MPAGNVSENEGLCPRVTALGTFTETYSSAVTLPPSERIRLRAVFDSSLMGVGAPEGSELASITVAIVEPVCVAGKISDPDVPVLRGPNVT